MGAEVRIVRTLSAKVEEEFYKELKKKLIDNEMTYQEWLFGMVKYYLKEGFPPRFTVSSDGQEFRKAA
jgi:hypothetical protein